MDASMGKKLLYGLITVVAYALFGWAFFHYRKVGAEWFGINIMIYTALAVVLVLFGATRLEWVSERTRSAPGQMFAIAAVGFAVCLFLGIFYTEPFGPGEVSADYNYAASRTGEQVLYVIGDIGGDSSSSSSGGSSFDLGDDGGEALVILLLIVLVVLLIFGSAFIPHFWVLACAVLIAVMGLLAFREVLLREHGYVYD